jgi:hypothetical protein
MKKYKVEIVESQKYVIDVLAKNEKEATELARKKFDIEEQHGVIHYHENGDRELAVSTIYDVTNTDDEFNP